MSAGSWCLECGHYHPVGAGCRTHVSGDLGLLMCTCEAKPGAQALAAALRRHAHEIDYDLHNAGPYGGNEADRARAEALRSRADRLDGSGS